MSLRIIFLICLFLPFPAFAMSQADYKTITDTSQELSEERHKMENLYAKLIKALGADKGKNLAAEQEKWFAARLDADAAAYLARGFGRIQAYARAIHMRHEELADMAKKLGITNDDKPLADGFFPSPGELDLPAAEGPMNPRPGSEVCGELVANLPVSGQVRLIILNAYGGDWPYYTDDESCRNIDEYVCAILGEKVETSPELAKAGVRSWKMRTIVNCGRRNPPDWDKLLEGK